ncbi:undecaprenyl diphosphate synthase family protein [Mycobacterium sp. CVI_P3]|uniref:Decaprenyl diphosphate synthase n=1 Tax=Mycobacterium pinniadriaticum TaxID=2994102 RepID=A0ABT3SGW2_9MYCO|nr:undecaprenyl diphosphate synthase family protein [Mycobacterium pinniadriaticum]MCX2932278.1 undecaprenyl diphosphate synthase family protein [Mycobacterium pinniadriaticum]MCX2938622.1 undecaprenyl diphosphate synthase family protein [Mycobacterium pinniadriaticum]
MPYGGPDHIAFIVDGNRRWAKTLNLAAADGHEAGLVNVTTIDDACRARGIRWRSYYVFSRENTNRDPAEVRFLLELFARYFVERKQRPGESVHIVGDLTAPAIPHSLRSAGQHLIEASHAGGEGLSNVVFFLNYSGARAGGSPAGIGCLDHLPDVDLLVRTGGEKRLSGFIPPQLAFSELAFVDCYWPDFTERHLESVIQDFGTRDRRFGADGVDVNRRPGVHDCL